MPIYEYHCKSCGDDFERMLRVSKMTNTAKCPKCGARANLTLSAFAIVGSAAPDFDSSDAEPGDFGGMGGGDDFDMGGMGGMDDDFDF